MPEVPATRRRQGTGAGWLGAAAVIAVVAAAAYAATDAETAAAYSAVTGDVCRIVNPVALRMDALGVVECPAMPGYRLFIASSDARSWIELERHDGLWSSASVVVGDRDINELGYFPNVGGADVVEWRLKASGRPAALIFRLVLQEPRTGALTGAQVSRLVVLGLFPERICYLGLAATNDEARRLATSGEEACRAVLENRPAAPDPDNSQ